MPTETPGRRNINDNGGSTLPSWMESDKEEEEENGLRMWWSIFLQNHAVDCHELMKSGGLLCCKLPELSCGSRWNDSGRSWCHSVAVGVRLFVCWLITLDKELGPDQHYWAPGSLLLTPLFSVSWQALGQRLLLFWMDQGALSQRILKEQKHSSTRWWKRCMRSALRYSLLSSAG